MSASETGQGDEKLTLKFYKSDKNGRYTLGMKGNKALENDNDRKYVTISITGADKKVTVVN